MNREQQRLAIALAADNAYSEQIITLIKSISYFHKNVDFYLFHSNEFTSIWLNTLNNYLMNLNSRIISCVVEYKEADQYATKEHISKATFFRYFLGHIPAERILYLDCDLVVDGNLDDFYFSDFNGKTLIAVNDFILNNVSHYYAEFPDMKPYFNAGVLLVNNPLWKERNIEQQLLTYNKIYPNVLYADQDILNIVLKEQWLAGNKIYNYQVGARFGIAVEHYAYVQNEENLSGQEPVIIHYTSQFKPWKPQNWEHILYKEKYWFYYQLSWVDIFAKHNIKDQNEKN